MAALVTAGIANKHELGGLRKPKMCCMFYIQLRDGDLTELVDELYRLKDRDEILLYYVTPHVVAFRAPNAEHTMTLRERMKLTKQALGFYQHARQRGLAVRLIQKGGPCGDRGFDINSDISPQNLCMEYFHKEDV